MTMYEQRSSERSKGVGAKAEQAFFEARDELEARVAERTAQLRQTVEVLQEEVAERIAARKTLEQRNETLQKIIDNIPVMLCFYDAEGRVSLINEELHKVLGYTLVDFRNHDVMELCYPNPAYRQEVRDFMMAARPGWRDLLVRNKAGRKVASSWANVRLSDGSYVGIGIDIRRRRRYETHIRESEERYRTLVELSPDGIGVERAGTIRFVNTTACRLLGAENPKDLIGTRVLDLVHPDHRRRTERQIEMLRRRRKPLPFSEAQVVGLDGRTLDVELSAMPITDQNKPAVQIVMRDITQRKAAERREAEARRFTESVLDTVQEALVVLDARLNVLSANRAFYETFAVAREETVGRTIYEIGNRRWDLPELRSLLETILPQNTSFEDFEVEQDFERIGHRIMRLNARRIHRDDQKTEMILLAIQDVTVRREQEQEIRQNHRQLAELTEELLLTEERERRRIAGALHDSIGQSLAFSKRELGVLRKDLPEPLQEKLDRAKQQIDEAVRQTRSLTFELSPSTLYMFGLEAAVEELAEQFSQQEGFTCHLDVQDGDEPLSEQTKVLLYRAVRELLINVAKHAEARNVFVRIQRVDGNVRIEVEDDGKGFDVSALEPPRGRRMTFGVFSLRQRLTHSNGSFDIRSTPGDGTTVVMQMPAHAHHKDDPRSES